MVRKGKERIMNKILETIYVIVLILFLLVMLFELIGILWSGRCHNKVADAVFLYNIKLINDGLYTSFNDIPYWCISNNNPSIVCPFKYWRCKDYVPEDVWIKIEPFIGKENKCISLYQFWQ